MFIATSSDNIINQPWDFRLHHILEPKRIKLGETQQTDLEQ